MARNPGRYSYTEIQPKIESVPASHGSVSIHAGPVGTFRGPIVAFAILGPIAAVALVLWLLPKAIGIEEIRLLREELVAARKEIEKLRADLREQSSEVAAMKLRERHNTELLAGIVNRLGSNVRFSDGTLPSVEFHPAPLNPRAAPVQPSETLQLPPPN